MIQINLNKMQLSNKFYILEGHEVKEVGTLIEWGQFFERGDRTVERTKIRDVMVSTVFLGLDHQYGLGGGQATVI